MLPSGVLTTYDLGATFSVLKHQRLILESRHYSQELVVECPLLHDVDQNCSSVCH